MQKNQFLFIISIIFAILVTLFAITNSEPVETNLFFYKFKASQALVIFVSAALGAITVTALGLTKYIRLINEIKKLRKENEALNKMNATEETIKEEQKQKEAEEEVSEKIL